MDSNKKYFATGYLKAKPGNVDMEKGIITDVKICSAGEALGHGVHLDSEFIGNVTSFGNDRKQGLKARFGHPNMCSTSLGTFLGRFKNFRTEKTIRENGDEADVSVADLYLSSEAKNTPNGNLYDYVCGMAQNEPDMFGTSIVYEPGKEYRKDKDGNKWYRVGYNSYSDGKGNVDDGEDLSDELYVECAELFACDCVDDPAANDGLFSKFANETVAGQISEFLDMNPQVVQMLTENPEVIKVISKYGKNIDEFFAKYQEYKKMEALKMAKETKKALNSDENKDETTVVEQETVSDEAAQETAGEQETATEETTVQQESGTIDRAELQSLSNEFGAEIAVKVALSGGGKAEAYKLKAEAAEKKLKSLESENEKLKKQKALDGGDAAEFSEEGKTKKTAWGN